MVSSRKRRRPNWASAADWSSASAVDWSSASEVKVSEISESEFRREIKVDAEKIVPAIEDLIADLDFLRYAWEASSMESGGATFVLVRPKEAAIDQRRWRRAVEEAQTGSGSVGASPVGCVGVESGSGNGVDERNGAGSRALPIKWSGGISDDDSGSRFDHEEWVEEDEMKVCLDPPETTAVLSSTATTESSSITTTTTTTTMPNNLDRWAKWRITDEDLLPKSAIKPELKSATKKKYKRNCRIIPASRCSVPSKLEDRKIIDLIRSSQVAIEIMRQDPDKAIENLQEFFGVRWKDGRPEKYDNENRSVWFKNPVWNVRIVAALYLDGAASFGQVAERARNKFESIRLHDDAHGLIQIHLGQLVAANVVSCKSDPSGAEVFQLTNSVKGDNDDMESSTTRRIAANIQRVFNHQLFLDAIEEVANVVSVIRNKELDRSSLSPTKLIYALQDALPKATVVQSLVLAILTEEVPGFCHGFVPKPNITEFVGRQFPTSGGTTICESAKRELSASLNSLVSIGVLEKEVNRYRLCEDLESVKESISKMTTSQLFGLIPPPIGLKAEELVVLALYIMDPLRSSVNRMDAMRFTDTKLFSKDVVIRSRRKPQEVTSLRSKSISEYNHHLWAEANLHGVVKNFHGFVLKNRCILTNAMFDSLDRLFQRDFFPAIAHLGTETRDEEDDDKDRENEEYEDEEKEGEYVEDEKGSENEDDNDEE